MNVNFLPLVIPWAALVLVVLAMIAYRSAVSRHEDDSLHVLHGAAAVPQQAAVAQKLEKIDRWGKLLTILAVVYGLLLGGLFLYQNWVQTSTTTGV